MFFHKIETIWDIIKTEKKTNQNQQQKKKNLKNYINKEAKKNGDRITLKA